MAKSNQPRHSRSSCRLSMAEVDSDSTDDESSSHHSASANTAFRFLGHALTATTALIIGFLVGSYAMHRAGPVLESTTSPASQLINNNATTSAMTLPPLEKLAADLQILHWDALRAFNIDASAAPTSAADVDACHAAVRMASRRLSRVWHTDKCEYARLGLMHDYMCAELYMTVQNKKSMAEKYDCLTPEMRLARAEKRIWGMAGDDDE
ncbi:hypothetical protein IWX49DRAFT_359054 [Phyllosticta citricarpa]|uniref:Uncharacterized protein n=1 Tax=Phyllosticta paracitricarpa TaxID=2016321 RepID=A0ABR1MSW6_9PEZI